MQALLTMPLEDKVSAWQSFYVVSRRWRSDMEFYTDELRFFKNIINRYFIWLIDDENLRRAEEMLADIEIISVEKDRLEERINKHLADIKSIMEIEHHYNEDIFEEDHATLENDVALFTKRYRNLKKEIIDVTENIIDTENFNHLLHH